MVEEQSGNVNVTVAADNIAICNARPARAAS